MNLKKLLGELWCFTVIAGLNSDRGPAEKFMHKTCCIFIVSYTLYKMCVDIIGIQVSRIFHLKYDTLSSC